MSKRKQYAMGEPLGDSATCADFGKKRIYGGGGSSGGSSTSTTTASIAPELKPLANLYVKQATDIANTPFQAYGGQRYADLNQTQNMGIGMVRNRALNGDPLIDAGASYLRNQLQSGPRAATKNPYGNINSGNANAGLVNSGNINSGSIYSGNANAGLVNSGNNIYAGSNPFLDAAVRRAQGSVVDNFNNMVKPQTESAMRNSGSFGNSGLDQMMQIQQKAAGQQMSDIASGMYMQDYGMQQGLAENAVNRNLAAQQFNVGNNLDAQKFNIGNDMAAQQFNVGSDMDAQKFNVGNSMAAQQFNVGSDMDAQKFNIGNSMAAQQFNVGSDMDAQKFNVGNNLAAQQFNVGSDMDAQKFNVGNNLAAQQFNVGNNMAAQQFNVGNNLDAQKFNIGNSMDAQKFNIGNDMAAQQFNGNMWNDWAGRNDAAYQNYMGNNLNATQQGLQYGNAAYQDASQLLNAGGIQQNQQQQGLDFGYNQFQEAQNNPYKQLAATGGVVGQNMGSTTTGTQSGGGGK